MPLSKAEIADFLDRGRVQFSVGTAIETARDSEFFAGAFLDQLSGGQAARASVEVTEGAVARSFRLDAQFQAVVTAAGCGLRLLMSAPAASPAPDSQSAMASEMGRPSSSSSQSQLPAGLTSKNT